MPGREREVKVVVLGDASGGQKALAALDASAGEAETGLGRVGEKFKNVGASMASFGAKMTVGVTAPLALVGKAAFDAASDLNESLSKSNTIFGDQAQAIEQWAGAAARSMGQSKKQALDAAGGFGNMFTQLGIGREQAAGMSRSMVELASDFASFHNADVTEVLDAQAAAFRGEYDAVQKFVPTINAAAVEQKALEMGLAGSTKELTAQDKALATQALLLGGAGAAMGDFARTADGAANKQRIVKAEFENTAAALGNSLMPIGEKVLGVLGALAEKFNGLSPTMQTVVVAVAGVLAAVGPLTTVIGGLAAAIGFLISPVGLVVVGIAALVAALVLAYQHSETFRNIVNGVFTVVRDVVMSVLDDLVRIVDGAFQIIKGIADVFAGIFTGDWSRVWDGVKAIFSGAWDVIVGVLGTMLTLIIAYLREVPGRALDALANLGSALAGLAGEALGWFRDRIKEVAGEAIDWLRGLPGRAVGALGNLGSLLWNAGWDIINGLWNGLKARAAEMLGWVGGLAGKIASLKGPLEEDRRLLIPAGQAIMDGLVAGLKDHEGRLVSQLSGITGMISGIGGDVSVTGAVPESTTSAAGGVTINLTVTAGTVVGSDGMHELVEMIQAELLRKQRRVPALGFS